MNNFKKIGMTALAASLVSTSVFAGELAVTGSASVNMEGHSSGTALTKATDFSMGNQLTFSGSGELDNGLTVALSFVLDQGDGVSEATAPFDNHSISISSDSLGTIVYNGEGGASAASALDTTAAGDMWDNFNNTNTGDGVTVYSSAPAGNGGNTINYTLPSFVDGLSAAVSYTPSIEAVNEAETGFSLGYTGVEGLSLSYGVADKDRPGTSDDGDQTVIKASYAYGPVTVAYSNSDYDVTGTGTDQETTSYKVSYTVSDAISISYGAEDISKVGAVDAEFTGFGVSYTAGGMTISSNMQDGKNIDNTTGADNQVDYWNVGLSFAF